VILGDDGPAHPGAILLEHYLIPRNISLHRLSEEIGLAAGEIAEIVVGRRPITEDTDMRLCEYFGTEDGYWLRAQAACDAQRGPGSE
jgi:addiction module HigA family antidote